jgi:alpha/beta superfamily hydrolase
VTAALDFLAVEFPATPLLVAGFSFGCFVGLRVGCKDDRVTECIGLGTPVNNTDVSFLHECAKPKLFVHGENDEFGDVKTVEQLVESLPGEKQLVVVPGVDHFFVGKLKEVDAAISEWMMERHQSLIKIFG